MAETRKNELTVRLEGDKVCITRVIEDIVDAEEYLRHINALTQQADARMKEMKSFTDEFSIISSLKEKVSAIREKEIAKAKEERERTK